MFNFCNTCIHEWHGPTLQALWRGYRLRKRIEYALNYAKTFDDTDDIDDEMNFKEVDLSAFDFDVVRHVFPISRIMASPNLENWLLLQLFQISPFSVRAYNLTFLLMMTYHH